MICFCFPIRLLAQILCFVQEELYFKYICMKVNEEVMDQENGQGNEDDIGLFDADQADEDDIIILENDEADFS